MQTSPPSIYQVLNAYNYNKVLKVTTYQTPAMYISPPSTHYISKAFKVSPCQPPAMHISPPSTYTIYKPWKWRPADLHASLPICYISNATNCQPANLHTSPLNMTLHSFFKSSLVLLSLNPNTMLLYLSQEIVVVGVGLCNCSQCFDISWSYEAMKHSILFCRPANCYSHRYQLGIWGPSDPGARHGHSNLHWYHRYIMCLFNNISIAMLHITVGTYYTELTNSMEL